MINPNFNINKAFKEQGTKCMRTTFGAITRSHVRTILVKNNIRVLALLIFYETRNNPKAYIFQSVELCHL